MASSTEKHFSANTNLSKRQIVVGNFLGGLAWGFGTIIGASVVVAIILNLSKPFGFIPIVNDFIYQIQKVSEERGAK